MGYTPELKELIKKVEATRPERLAKARREEHYPALSIAERHEVLNKFHPDYQSKQPYNPNAEKQTVCF